MTRFYMVDPDNEERLLKIPHRVVAEIKAEAWQEAHDAVTLLGEQHPKWTVMSTHYEGCWKHHSACALQGALDLINALRVSETGQHVTGIASTEQDLNSQQRNDSRYVIHEHEHVDWCRDYNCYGCRELTEDEVREHLAEPYNGQWHRDLYGGDDEGS